MIFFDTCSLLNNADTAFERFFAISTITLKELEHIKSSLTKDEEIKYKARKLVKLLNENEDKYEVVSYLKSYDGILEKTDFLPDNNDSRIIITASKYAKAHPDVIFKTDDYCCKILAKTFGLNVEYKNETIADDYTGFYEVSLTETELANFYDLFATKDHKYEHLINNEYLIIRDEDGEVVDKYRYTENGLKGVPFYSFDSSMFGKIKPKDIYQQIAMDSLENNQITVLRGPAGSGKSLLSLGCLFYKLEKHQIDKIIIFCNTVATAGSAKLGFYPGERTTKLLDSQIGNFLESKLGDKIAVEQLIQQNKLALLPMSDIRGYDTSGMRAGIYITEAQNLDIELMRLALQRVGEDSICILDGDDRAQVDLALYAGSNNGLRRVSEIFRGSSIYGETTLQKIRRSQIAELAQQM